MEGYRIAGDLLTEAVQPVRKELNRSGPVGDNILWNQSARKTRRKRGLMVRYC